MTSRRSDDSPDDPMPVFVIKAKDNLAVSTIGFYVSQCFRYGLREQEDEVAKALKEIIAWRLRNQDLCKDPDHKHVPVEAVGA